MSISPKNLNAKLLGKKIVKVKSKTGEDVEFEIQKVSIETFAGEGNSKLDNIIGKSQEEIKKMFVDQFKSQEISKLIAPVILEGVSEPKVVNKEISECNLENEIPLKVLLIDLELSTNLYFEILEISVGETNK